MGSPAVDVGTILLRIARAHLGGEPTSGTMTIVVDSSHRIVLVKPRYRRWWCLPGGFLDPGEDVSAGAAREVLEETGVVLHDAPIAVAQRQRSRHLDHLFLAQASNERRPVSTAWEIGSLGWFDIDAAPPLHPLAATMIDEQTGGLRGIIERTLRTL